MELTKRLREIASDLRGMDSDSTDAIILNAAAEAVEKLAVLQTENAALALKVEEWRSVLKKVESLLIDIDGDGPHYRPPINFHEVVERVGEVLIGPPTEAEQRAKDNAEKSAKWDEYMACVEADDKLAAAMRDGEELKECTTFGPAAIERRAKDDERRKTDPQITMWLSDYKAMQSKANLLSSIERELICAHEGGGSDVVLGYDDATRNYFVQVNTSRRGKTYSGQTLECSITRALQADRRD